MSVAKPPLLHTTSWREQERIFFYHHSSGKELEYRSGYGTALLVGGSRDRSPVMSLGIFSVATDATMCPGVDSRLSL